MKELEELVKIFGPSGFEQDVHAYFEKIMKPLCDEVYYDHGGNCYAHMEGDTDLPHIMFQAHADSIGSMVNLVDSKGFLSVKDIPGWDQVDRYSLPGTRVQVHSRKTKELYEGIYTPNMPVHLLDPEIEEGDFKRKDLVIDMGHSCAEDVTSIIQRGDYVAFLADPRYIQLGERRFIQSANLDDRAGCYAAYKLAQQISKLSHGGPVTFCLTAHEETVGVTAFLTSGVVKPDIAITLEVTIANDHVCYDNEEEAIREMGVFMKLGDGVSLCRGIGCDDALFCYLEELADSQDIKHFYEHAVHETENHAISLGRKGGVVTAITSIPMRYPHTPFEMICEDDIDSVVALNTAFYQAVADGDYVL